MNTEQRISGSDRRTFLKGAGDLAASVVAAESALAQQAHNGQPAHGERQATSQNRGKITTGVGMIADLDQMRYFEAARTDRISAALLRRGYFRDQELWGGVSLSSDEPYGSEEARCRTVLMFTAGKMCL